MIAAAVIGGTSFAGGIGTIPGAVLGAVVMQSLRSGMLLLRVDSPIQDIVVGVVLVAAVALRHVRPRAERTMSEGAMTIDQVIEVESGAAPASVPLVEMRDIRVAFGGVHAVDGVTVDLYPGEVVGLVGGNGAGKSTLIRALSGAHPADSGRDPDRRPSRFRSTNPRDAKALGIETIYQTLALADNIDAAGNMFLGRELRTRTGALDDAPWSRRPARSWAASIRGSRTSRRPVKSLSGGQRQSVAIARAVHFNARILIMDEPTAALGPAETAQVRSLIRQLKDEGIGIFLISHDIHDVFDLSDRISVMLHGKLVGTVDKATVTKDEVLAMIIMGKLPGEVSADGSRGAPPLISPGAVRRAAQSGRSADASRSRGRERSVVLIDAWAPDARAGGRAVAQRCSAPGASTAAGTSGRGRGTAPGRSRARRRRRRHRARAPRRGSP